MEQELAELRKEVQELTKCMKLQAESLAIHESLLGWQKVMLMREKHELFDVLAKTKDQSVRNAINKAIDHKQLQIEGKAPQD